MKKYMMYVALCMAFLFAGSTIVNAQTETTTTKKHRPWSNRAKGAAIGGGAGAVAGGLIGHNVGGALIGGAIGAGGGYIIGDAKDRANLRKRQAYRRAHPHRKTKVVYVKSKPKSVTVTTVTKTTKY